VIVKLLSFVIVGSVLCAHALEAQTVPRWSVELAGGAGRHIENAGAIWYENDASPVLRLAVSRRLGPEARLAPYVSVEAGPDLISGRNAICYTAPNGTCLKTFADNGSFGVGVGAKYALISRVLVGTQVGGGYYDSHARAFLEANAALRVVSHLSLTSAVREMRWSSRGYGYWFRPVTFGIQIN